PPSCEVKSTWLATARGRAGYAIDRILIYGTGGAAFANVQAAAGVLPLSSSTEIGWTAGAGVEFAFTPNLTGKVEYLYVNLGNQSCPAVSCAAIIPGVGGVPTTVSLTENIVRAGNNYKFW
ncbi:MAG: outer membrane protein, partial [Beijerinckiaceae bacterium]